MAQARKEAVPGAVKIPFSLVVEGVGGEYDAAAYVLPATGELVELPDGKRRPVTGTRYKLVRNEAGLVEYSLVLQITLGPPVE